MSFWRHWDFKFRLCYMQRYVKKRSYNITDGMAEKTIEDLERAMSVRLFDIMDNAGASRKIQKLHLNLAIKRELNATITNQMRNIPDTIYIFGSASEGTTTEDLNSDLDMVECDDRYQVIDHMNIQRAPIGQSFLIVRDDTTYSGYVKLQLLCDGVPQTLHNADISEEYEPDDKGRLCLKHRKARSSTSYGERHGPADTLPKIDGVQSRDFVYALRCNTISGCANDWLHRHGNNLGRFIDHNLSNDSVPLPVHWLSRDDIQKMSELGCFFVGVGHTSSNEARIEWRVSFSLQERFLMYSLNPTQYKCYILLKMLKNDTLHAELGDCLSSYQCKTCLLYTIENTPTIIWRPRSLILCVHLCLLVLLSWVYKGNCPNFFIPSENMLDTTSYRENRNGLLTLLRRLVIDIVGCISRIKCDRLGEMFKNASVQNNTNDRTVYLKCMSFIENIEYSQCKIYTDDNESCASYECVKSMMRHLKLLEKTRVISGHTVKQTRDVILYRTPALNLYTAQCLASLASTAEDKPEFKQLLKFSNYFFLKGRQSSLMTSRLMKGTLYLRLKQYDVCENILEDIEKDVSCYVHTLCKCYRRKPKINRHLQSVICHEHVSLRTVLKDFCVPCVKFLRRDIDLVPLPIQYEMYRSMDTNQEHADRCLENWFDWAVVDGKIYLYFMKYLVYSKLNKPVNKQVAIEKLISVLDDDENLGHKETAYNLLGWIHVQEGRLPEALRCYITSWKIRPWYNAAKFHVRQLGEYMCEVIVKHQEKNSCKI